MEMFDNEAMSVINSLQSFSISFYVTINKFKILATFSTLCISLQLFFKIFIL